MILDFVTTKTLPIGIRSCLNIVDVNAGNRKILRKKPNMETPEPFDLSHLGISDKDLGIFRKIVDDILKLQPTLKKMFVTYHEYYDRPILVDTAMLQGLILLTNDIIFNMIRHMRLGQMNEEDIMTTAKGLYLGILATFESGHKQAIELAREEIVQENLRNRPRKQKKAKHS